VTSALAERAQKELDAKLWRERKRRRKLINRLDKLNGQPPKARTQEWLDQNPIVEPQPRQRKAFAVEVRARCPKKFRGPCC
jgi:hypothetical protein